MKNIFQLTFDPVNDKIRILHAEDAIQACVFINTPLISNIPCIALAFPEFKNQINVLKQIEKAQKNRELLHKLTTHSNNILKIEKKIDKNAKKLNRLYFYFSKGDIPPFLALTQLSTNLVLKIKK